MVDHQEESGCDRLRSCIDDVRDNIGKPSVVRVNCVAG